MKSSRWPNRKDCNHKQVRQIMLRLKLIEITRHFQSFYYQNFTCLVAQHKQSRKTKKCILIEQRSRNNNGSVQKGSQIRLLYAVRNPQSYQTILSIYCINNLADQRNSQETSSSKGFEDCRSPSLTDLHGASVWIPSLRTFHFKRHETGCPLYS